MFGISGLTEHWQSTVLGLLGIAATGGLLTPTAAATLGQAAPQILAGASALASVLGLLYKGKQ